MAKYAIHIYSKKVMHTSATLTLGPHWVLRGSPPLHSKQTEDEICGTVFTHVAEFCCNPTNVACKIYLCYYIVQHITKKKNNSNKNTML